MDLEESEALDAILAKIPDEPEQTAQPSAAETPSEQVEQQAEETVEQERVEPEATPAIEPPPTWKAELKNRWKDIPADLQREFAQWETERNQGVNSKLNESAEVKKAAEAERASAAQERQRYAQQLDTLIQQFSALDPVLAQAQKFTPQEWTKFARENPAEAFAFQQEYQTRANAIAAWNTERQRLVQDDQRTNQSKSEAELAKAIPEWSDQTRGPELRANIKNTLVQTYGYKPEELNQLTDHRSVLVARDAMLYRQMMAAKETAQTKKVAPPPAKTVKPGSAQNEGTRDQRVDALKQRAMRSGRDNDVFAAIMAATKDMRDT